ncbi:MAG: plastocyanin/azurin family copper-binding protein [Actinomycetota bacterium]|nr:plastocyanin/azurin family copper-binding protein [Actinomycetota bacterium]
MKRALAAAITCGALALAAGCGSSSGSGGHSSSSASSSSSTSAPSGGGLKPTTTPKYGVPSPSQPVQSGIVAIAYRNITIAPDTVRVKLGSTIRWTNYDAVEHNVTSQNGPQQFASKNFPEGQTYAIKATRPGLIRYLCTIHPASMNGTIEVLR